MMEKFDLVQQYLTDMNMSILKTDEKEELFIVDDEDNGIKNMVIDCEEPILILEQIIMDTPSDSNEFYRDLLRMNRQLVHGAFVLDKSASKVIYRDTLQIDNLDMNELEASINSLSLALSEFGTKLISYAH
ncbi:MAG: YbjN domain-containing protein [Deltaproteobacteria bacterium]|nr:YbjN domain-containing protein [Deltaproteobacteria bacterium]